MEIKVSYFSLKKLIQILTFDKLRVAVDELFKNIFFSPFLSDALF